MQDCNNKFISLVLSHQWKSNIPSSENMFSHTKYRGISYTIMHLQEFLQKISHFKCLLHVVLLFCSNSLLYQFSSEATKVTKRKWYVKWIKFTWFISMVWRPSPLVKIIAWFWFSGFPSPNMAGPGSLIL